MAGYEAAEEADEFYECISDDECQAKPDGSQTKPDESKALTPEKGAKPKPDTSLADFVAEVEATTKPNARDLECNDDLADDDAESRDETVTTILSVEPVQRTLIALVTGDMKYLKKIQKKLPIDFDDVVCLSDRFRESLGFPLCLKWLTIDPRRATKLHIDTPKIKPFQNQGKKDEHPAATARRYSDHRLSANAKELNLEESPKLSVFHSLDNHRMTLVKVQATQESPNGRDRIIDDDNGDDLDLKFFELKEFMINKQVYHRGGPSNPYLHLRAADNQEVCSCWCPRKDVYCCKTCGLKHVLVPASFLIKPKKQAADIILRWLVLYKVCGIHGIPKDVEVGYTVFQRIWDFIRHI